MFFLIFQWRKFEMKKRNLAFLKGPLKSFFIIPNSFPIFFLEFFSKAGSYNYFWKAGLIFNVLQLSLFRPNKAPFSVVPRGIPTLNLELILFSKIWFFPVNQSRQERCRHGLAMGWTNVHPANKYIFNKKGWVGRVSNATPPRHSRES